MELEGIIIFNSSSGINLFSMVDEGLEPGLISGALTAIKHFCQAISLGGLSSFTTEEKLVFLATKGEIGTAIITSKNHDPKHAYTLAIKIAETFERNYENIEITTNFLLNSKLPKSHYAGIENLIGNDLDRKYGKGCIYFSPMTDETNTIEMRKTFIKLKNASRLPAFIYSIQRL